MFKRELRRFGSRKIYLFGMVLVPVFVAVFFMSLLSPSLPNRVPTAVVDLDHSEMSREVTRNLKALQTIDIVKDYESYDAALAGVRRGEVFGFFVIPAEFQKKTLSMQSPTLEYFSNLTYFVPGTLAFKGFKTTAVATTAGVVQQTLTAVGIENTASLIQPVSIDIFGIGNPWMSYAIYLCPTFSMATLVLMIMLMTALSITNEIKNGTSVQWLASSGGSMLRAVVSKLVPQTVVFWSVGLFILWLLYGYGHFPLNGSLWVMIAATMLMVVASQALGLLIASVLPNPRMSFIVCALTGILAFSFTGFSFPVESMYGYLGVFSWLAPVRYWFLIYINESLNGYALFYSRYFFVALICFVPVSLLFLRNLRKACLNPVYVP